MEFRLRSLGFMEFGERASGIFVLAARHDDDDDIR